jgi:hypothetical protein
MQIRKGNVMKAVFFSINLVFALAGLILGVAACWIALSTTHSVAAAVAGVVTLFLARICFCMCGGCLSDRDQRHA